MSRIVLGCGNFGGIGSAPAFFGMGTPRDEAFRLLGRYLATNPQMRAGLVKDETWLLRDLRSDPRFATVVGVPN